MGFLHLSNWGFRSKLSTGTALAHFTDNVLQNTDAGSSTGAVFLDLSEDFDTVDHPLLLQKLTNNGLTTSTTQWFRSYLTNRSQITSVGDAHSASTEMPIGVPRQYIGTFIVFNLRECSSGLSSGKWYYSLCGRYCTVLLIQKRQWSWTSQQCWLGDSVWVVL